jgi:23S rRNA (cytosine1962-C5)-methyltransferase
MEPTMTPQAVLEAIAAIQEIPTDAHRVFHGRGGAYPGCEHWTLDAYPPVWLLTSFQPVADDELTCIQAALSERWARLAPGVPLNLVFQHRDEVKANTHVLAGEVPDPHVVSEQGARFKVHLPRGMNHGLFLDMAEGRRWVRDYVAERPGIKVLNLFAYTCAFSVVALQAGAGQVINVDMADGALNIGKQNHHLNGLTCGASFMPHDIFSSWGKIGRNGPYDLVIMDPPTYQKGSFVAEKDYARLMRRMPDLLAPDGHALLCLNSPKLGVDFLQDQMREQAPGLDFVARLPNPPAFVDVSGERALKVLVYRACP